MNQAALVQRLGRFLPSGRSLVIGIPFGFLTLFFLVPFLVVLKISLSDQEFSIPPYSDLTSVEDFTLSIRLNFEHYRTIFTDNLYLLSYLSSLKVAALNTLICLLIGYPTAYLIARASPRNRNLLLMAIILPFWTSYLIRVYAWIGLLKDQGLINQVLLWTGLVDTPLRLYRNDIGLHVGLAYSYLPYLILPLYAHLVKMDTRLLEAAHDLGAKAWESFLTITLPLSTRGIVAGSLLVFIPSVGEYVIPEILGSSDSMMIGRVMWDDFFNNTDWPVASAATCVMVLLLLLPMAWFQTVQNKELKRA
ncbi:ABC transporter permease subunit [Metapseudomonas resinovorans]|uniref:Polyamine ABC transporter permease protein SpuG n=1 Tax=Metapseudomonas resinovorans NBRC 106553 TaxID=1245471 RepID=S6AZV4_METRE|nr:ABC transporter permease subunit [Pseudomonas resinovorans]BAN50456.1 polyamine ABC transporter permease protein SpuG [Pseudomonas resinovorans NBRC 106553]